MTENTERAQVGWGFWLWWVLASIVGLVVGLAVDFILIGMTFAFIVVFALGLAVLGTVFGASIGIAQWLVLRRQVAWAGRWVLASTAGGAVGGALGFAVNRTVGEAMALAVFGASIGIVQWLVLRRQVSHAGWWVLASIVGLAVGLATGGAVFNAMGGDLGFAVSVPVAEAMTFVASTAVVYAAITGGVMVWLLRPLAQTKAFESAVLTCPVCDSNRIINHRGIFHQLMHVLDGSSSGFDFTCKNCLNSWDRPARYERQPVTEEPSLPQDAAEPEGERQSIAEEPSYSQDATETERGGIKRWVWALIGVGALTFILVLIGLANQDAVTALFEAQPAKEARAEALYENTVISASSRSQATGIFYYNADEIAALEEVVRIYPEHWGALHNLAWAYSTYEEFLDNDSLHEQALIYAQEAFDLRGEIDVAMYGILGAAFYANGFFVEGDAIFDQAAKRMESEEQRQQILESKNDLLDMYMCDRDLVSISEFSEQNVSLRKPTTTSRTNSGEPGRNAVDGIKTSTWNAGSYAPQWIGIDLGAPTLVTSFELEIAQSPAGKTHHQLWIHRAGGEPTLVQEFIGITSAQTVLEYTPDLPLTCVRSVHVVTLESPSWVAWQEIEIMGMAEEAVRVEAPLNDPSPPSGTLDLANCEQLAGWAWDPKTPSQPIEVQIYDHFEDGTEELVVRIVANLSRTDVVRVTGDNGMHGFVISTLAALRDGLSHTIRAYAVNSDARFPNRILNGSDVQVRCP